MKRRNSAFPKVTITSLLEVTHDLWLDCLALSHDLWLDFALQITPKSLSASLLLSPSVSLSHTDFPICSQFVFNVFSMCPALVSFLPCHQIKLFLQLSYVPSISLIHFAKCSWCSSQSSHSLPGLFLQFLCILILFPIAPQLLLRR